MTGNSGQQINRLFLNFASQFSNIALSTPCSDEVKRFEEECMQEALGLKPKNLLLLKVRKLDSMVDCRGFGT